MYVCGWMGGYVSVLNVETNQRQCLTNLCVTTHLHPLLCVCVCGHACMCVAVCVCLCMFVCGFVCVCGVTHQQL